MTTCVWCGDPIRQRMSWPAARLRWFASVPDARADWPFCPDAPEGVSDHEPLQGTTERNPR